MSAVAFNFPSSWSSSSSDMVWPVMHASVFLRYPRALGTAGGLHAFVRSVLALISHLGRFSWSRMQHARRLSCFRHVHARADVASSSTSRSRSRCCFPMYCTHTTVSLRTTFLVALAVTDRSHSSRSWWWSSYSCAPVVFSAVNGRILLSLHSPAVLLIVSHIAVMFMYIHLFGGNIMQESLNEC